VRDDPGTLEKLQGWLLGPEWRWIGRGDYCKDCCVVANGTLNRYRLPSRLLNSEAEGKFDVGDSAWGLTRGDSIACPVYLIHGSLYTFWLLHSHLKRKLRHS
jgi:hypothetical protein